MILRFWSKTVGKLILSCVAIWPLISTANTTIVLDQAGQRPVELFTQALLEKAYSNVGVNIKYIPIPLARSYVEANAGRIDGLRGRVGFADNRYPNLVKIEYPLIQFNVVLVVDHTRGTTCSEKDLKKVGTVRGFRALEHYLESHILNLPIVEFTDRNNVLEQLQAHRLDAVILTESMIEDHWFSTNPKWSRYLLTSTSTFHFLHKRHTALASRISDEIVKLEVSGWIDEQRHRFQLDSLSNLQLYSRYRDAIKNDHKDPDLVKTICNRPI